MWGSHMISHWSSTQATIALSVAEAELNAMVKGGCEGIGLQYVLGDLGIESSIFIKTDSNSAKGILQRQGSGKVKHLEARQLWMQERVSRKQVNIVKVPRADNPSDALTHAWSGVEAEVHFPRVGLQRYCGFTGTTC